MAACGESKEEANCIRPTIRRPFGKLLYKLEKTGYN